MMAAAVFCCRLKRICNEASRKTIIKNGGILENEIELDGETGSKEIIQRFWIKL